MNTHEKLVELASPYIEAYRNDLLVHDKNAIDGCEDGMPFIHVTRKWGTHIIMLLPADHPTWPKKDEVVKYLFGRASRERILNGDLEVIKYLANAMRSEDVRLVLYFNGKTLRPINMSEAVWIIEAHIRKVQAEWRKEK